MYKEDVSILIVNNTSLEGLTSDLKEYFEWDTSRFEERISFGLTEEE